MPLAACERPGASHRGRGLRYCTLALSSGISGAMDKQIICINWGTKYGAPYINRLYGMVERNITGPFTFNCYTDSAEGVRPEVICRDLPPSDIVMPESKGIWPKSRLWNKTLEGLSGPVLFLDLDLVITGNLDGFFEYGDPDDVILGRNPTTPFEKLGQTSIFRFPIGKLAPLLDIFGADPQGIADKYEFEQRFVTRNAPGGVKFWPKPWIRHFRTQCIPFFPLNYIWSPWLPKDARVVIFPATPNPPDALEGRWWSDVPEVDRWTHIKRTWTGPRNVRGRFRHLRRFLLPTPWIAEHWRE